MSILKQAEAGMPVSELYREHGMSSTTFYKWRDNPKQIRCNNGPEYVTHLLAQWARKNQAKLLFTQPGNPQQNAYFERYNRTVRYDWLSQHLFSTIERVQDFSTRWLCLYNNERPNMAIGGILPAKKLALAA